MEKEELERLEIIIYDELSTADTYRHFVPFGSIDQIREHFSNTKDLQVQVEASEVTDISSLRKKFTAVFSKKSGEGIKMALDEKLLIEKVEKTIEETFSGDTYSHNLRLEFGNADDMMRAKSCLSGHYINRFKISTEIQPSINASFDKYYVLMEVF